MKQKDLDIYDWEIQEPRVDRLARDVLERIPDTYAPDFPGFSVSQGHSREGAHLDGEAITLDPDKLLGWPKAVAIGVVAHEFAHRLLQHGETGPTGLDEEYEADRLAREWGFGEEVTAMRASLGLPTGQ